jgi:solute carrier family 13 (sodium-dependent dicarboxylate transporter), member 2/3/5
MALLKKYIWVLLGPVSFLIMSFLPVPKGITPEAWKVLAMASLMLIWWISEAVPIAVTSLLPLVLLPSMGVAKLEAAAAPYANPVVYLFMGGFVIALAMEKWELHKRIALFIVNLSGTHANGIIGGFMLATASISMWISNTATAIMMLPIGLSIITLMQSQVIASKENEKGLRNFAIAMMLAIASGANIGGSATIIGTPPNVVFAGYMRENFNQEVTFLTWMMIGLPFAIVLLIFAYFVIVKILFPNNLGDFGGAKEIISNEIKSLGPMTVGEKLTLFVFVSTALSWIFRLQLDAIFPALRLSDTTIALIAAILLFIIPVSVKKKEFLLNWSDTEKLPWGILLLFGGGLSLADALASTGIINVIGEQFNGLDTAGWVFILGLTTVSLFLTEVMSNVALVTIFLPVVGAIAVGAGIAPIQLCIPVTIAASCAFMFPMSTPPNAIVFASGRISISQMAKAGFILNLLTIIVIAFLVKFLFPFVLGS